MNKFTENFKKIMKIPFTVFVIMLLFLAAVLGTSGSLVTTGGSYELVSGNGVTGDAKEPCIIFKVSSIKKKDKDGKETTTNVLLSHVYLNIGTIYSEEETVTFRLKRSDSSSESASFYQSSGLTDAVISNPWAKAVKTEESEGEEAKEETEEGTASISDAVFQWVECFTVNAMQDSYRKITSSTYYQLSLPNIKDYTNSNVLVNEIVFVGEELDSDGEGTGVMSVLPVTIDERSYQYMPESNSEMSKTEALKSAALMIDAQKMPDFTQSSFVRYTESERDLLSTLAEIRLGSRYTQGDVYHGDRTNNSLSVVLALCGTKIFGNSPFGLRFFSSLASFGILVVGYFFVLSLFKNEKAGLSFAVLYALAGISVSIAHVGAPVLVGVFFLLSALTLVYRYFDGGMKRASALGTLPLALAGVCGALSVLIQGAFVIPVAGVVGLFIAGVLKNHRADRREFDEAIEGAEAEGITSISVREKAGEEGASEKRLRRAYNAYRYKTGAASGVFGISLILGIFVFSLLFAIPVSYAFTKVYTGSGTSTGNLFTLAWKAFAAGFGTSPVNGWQFFLRAYEGTQTKYAVTLVSVNPIGAVIGLLGIVYAVYRIVGNIIGKRGIKGVENTVVVLSLLLLSLICAAVTRGGAFVFMAYLAAFMLAAGGAEQFREEGDWQEKSVKIGKFVALGLLIVWFALVAIFTFSIPVSASLISKIF